MPGSASRRHLWLPWIVAFLGIATSFAAWRLALAYEAGSTRTHFESHASERASAIQQQLTRDVSAVESMAAVFTASQRVTRAEFRAVTGHLLARHRSLRALSWNPVVGDEGREAHEASGRRAGFPDYRIRERAASGEMIPAARRPRYCIVHYIEPQAGNEAALGYDVSSEPTRRAALERALETGEMTFTGGIELVQAAESSETGFLVFHPHFGRGSPQKTPSERRASLEGFVVGVFQVADIVAAALGKSDRYPMHVRIEDVSDSGAGEPLYTSPQTDASPGRAVALVHTSNLEAGGRSWRLTITPGPGGFAADHGWLAGAVLLAGLLVTALATAYLAVVLGRTRRIQQLAHELRDEIRRRERAEAARRRLDAKLRDAQKLESLGLLAGGIAHDFNNLLTGILGNADLALLELSSESPGREELEEIRLASTRAAELTRQMLAYSGRGHVQLTTLDLSRLVEEMIHLLEPSVSKRAQLRCHCARPLPAVLGDPTQIRQVVMNLITNASDALGEESGMISVRTGVRDADAGYLAEALLDATPAPGRHVFVEVCDDGCGMDEATLARIFDPFFTTKSKGRGLGLATALGIVRSHQGAIRVESRTGSRSVRGTRFTVLLPAAEGVATEARSAARGDGETWRGSGTVLVVDDEEPVRRLAARVLGRLGFSVRTAADGREGLEAFQKHADEIVAVVLDLTMPGMSGAETLRAMRTVRPGATILLSSGYDADDSIRTLGGEQPDGFLQKPYSARGLARALRAVLGD